LWRIATIAKEAGLKFLSRNYQFKTIRKNVMLNFCNRRPVSFLPDFESLSKKALEKGLNYFTQGYIHNIKISEARAGLKFLSRNYQLYGNKKAKHGNFEEILLKM
jgi:hypothetical protein